ncbi:MAG: hypothetical protein H6834_08350 [Planctomycetes bacterium]|nr:hypothetical protein [Planctomycetota bacterium]
MSDSRRLVARSWLALNAAFLLGDGRAQGLFDGFQRSAFFEEQVRLLRPVNDVRVLLNAPAERVPSRPWTVLFFATPNGNTLEQTLGCRPAPGLDWHYDIQHVAAQVRRLREVAPDENLVLACLEAEGLSWPAWRARHGGGGAGVRAIVQSVLDALPGDDAHVVLSGHSGGGSFLWGFIEDGDALPNTVERIVFLDANYSYSDELHGRKLLTWLEHASTHLVVLAYDDREITYQGKKVIGPTGGTYRATQRMLDFFAPHVAPKTTADGALERTVGLEGRFHVLRHANPANRILHTALVGDMNGLLYALTIGTEHANDWGTFGKPRAYERWIQPVPGTGIVERTAIEPRPLPTRAKDAPGGNTLMREVAELSLAEREQRILEAIDQGNVPAFLRRFVTLKMSLEDARGKLHRVQLHVSPDYLAIGSDEDFARVPLTPMSAQHVVDRYGYALPTRRIVDLIHEHSTVRLQPAPLGEPRQAVATFLEHDRLIEERRKGHKLGLLVAGVKKDVVVTPVLATKPGKVAIYGWHHPDGKPIQPLYTGHIATYVDYSHGIRLVDRTVTVDGKERTLEEVLADPVLHALLSDEGPFPLARQRYRYP